MSYNIDDEAEQEVPEQEEGEAHTYDLQLRYQQRQNQVPHEIRTLSSAEYYTKAGFKRTVGLTQNAKNQANIGEIERTIATNRTANIDGINHYIRSILDAYNGLTEFYGRQFHRQLKFRNYRGRQRMDAELTNIFINGGNKYGDIGEQSGRPRRSRYRRRRGDRRPFAGTGPLVPLQVPLPPTQREPAGERTL